MRGNVSRNVSNNEKLSRPSFIMSPWLVKKTCIHGDPCGKQCYFWRDSEKRPTSIPNSVPVEETEHAENTEKKGI